MRAASKASTWFRDPSTYPLIACMTVATVMCSSFAARQLFQSPEVKLNRNIRMNPNLALEDPKRAVNWVSHRDRMKGLHDNAINKSK